MRDRFRPSDTLFVVAEPADESIAIQHRLRIPVIVVQGFKLE
jgi:hypothetical protein